VEYTFWDDRLPEALVRFGDVFPGDSSLPSERATHHLECALTATMLDLQKSSCARDASAFEVLLSRRRGVGMYGFTHRPRAAVARRRLIMDPAGRVRLL
jgi:hypothetical protein